MKLYQVTVRERESQAVVEDIQERAITKKALTAKFKNKYLFHVPAVRVVIDRIRKKPGVQVNLLDMIEECENEK